MGELETGKVFSSSITRNNNVGSKDLYDLLCITPANPIVIQKDKSDAGLCAFHPNVHKYYIHKKKSRLKVKTVRDIRNEFEKDVYAYLPEELEKQQNMLLLKIKDGASANEQFKTLSRKMMNADCPVTRTAWQMLININPNSYKYPKQYVLWNGRYINISGSQGGSNKFICKYDLGSSDIKWRKSFNFKKKSKKIGLLKNSLFVKFKPGPLGTKKQLDDSHQRHNVGEIELIRLPAPSLDVCPTYGISLDGNVTQFLNNLRDVSGNISEKWAEFSTSVVGTIIKSKPIQNVPLSKITFDLNYKYHQNRILMRRDTDMLYYKNKILPKDFIIGLPTEDTMISEVRGVVNKMLDYIELSLLQDTLFTEFDEPRENNSKDYDGLALTQKEKTKRKYKELNRLDVTVIQLPDKCQNSFCELGCVCESLEYSHSSKQHCGLLKCMFGCKCGFHKYKDPDILAKAQVLPGFTKLDEERSLKLAREEQKFHQTVIVSGEKRILLKANDTKHKVFTNHDTRSIYNRDNLLIDKELSVVTRKLILKNVQPWCMVHNLYKCFCKNRFIEKLNYVTDISNLNMSINESFNGDLDKQPSTDCADNSLKIITRQDKRQSNEKFVAPVVIDDHDCVCARITAFHGRQYNEDYYKVTNKRILEMEQNDRKLQKKLIVRINNKGVTHISESSGTSDLTTAPSSDLTAASPSNLTAASQSDLIAVSQSDLTAAQPLVDNWDIESELLNLLKPENNPDHYLTTSTDTQSITHPVSNSKFISWLESSYKLYKMQLEKGIADKALLTPKQGKLALHSWEFILDRYKSKKNFFLVSKDKPFRIFMAVNCKHPSFGNCINIDNIRLADLNYFPDTVKKLVTDCKNLKENFCILRGHSHCWEIDGLVAKKCEEPIDSDGTDDFNLSDTSRSEFNDSGSNSSMMLHYESSNPCSFVEKTNASKDIESNSSESFSRKTSNENAESSRWFVMRIENDFSEIQFHNKGFFVKYKSILKAIDVARKSNKTVRISSQKCNEKGNGPQFGIYAIPNANEYCVFVGPYELDEPLGIETIKTFLDVRKQKRTRGVWITTNKIDNLNLINNPMSYMPLSHKGYKDMSLICDDSDLQAESSKEQSQTDIKVVDFRNDNHKEAHVNNATTSSTGTQKAIKIVKPIKIRKVDAVYQIAPKPLRSNAASDKEKTSGLQFVSIQQVYNNSDRALENRSKSLLRLNGQPATVSSEKSNGETYVKVKNKKPVAQIAPLVNDNAKCNLGKEDRTNSGVNRGLIILKPEEVVKILTEKKSALASSLENLKAKLAMPEDILVISDDDEDQQDVDMSSEPKTGLGEWQNVKICCSTVNWDAWLPGRKNDENLLSFTFPGCRPSIFYKEEEALSEVNRIFHSKVKVPANVGLMWQVIETDEDMEDRKALTPDTLNPDFVLTSTGLQNKDSLPTQVVMEHGPDEPTNLFEVRSLPEVFEESSESSVQNAIVMEDGSLFVMDEKNKNSIADKLVGSSDTEKAEYINVLELLKSHNT